MDRAQTTWPTGDLHRRAPAVLKMQINKSERNDAADNARTSQALLTKIKRDLGNQIRGLFKKHWPCRPCQVQRFRRADRETDRYRPELGRLAFATSGIRLSTYGCGL